MNPKINVYLLKGTGQPNPKLLESLKGQNYRNWSLTELKVTDRMAAKKYIVGITNHERDFHMLLNNNTVLEKTCLATLLIPLLRDPYIKFSYADYRLNNTNIYCHSRVIDDAICLMRAEAIGREMQVLRLHIPECLGTIYQ